MQPITIYFNEKSLHGELNSHQWQVGVNNLCNAFDNFFTFRSDGIIAFIDCQIEIKSIFIQSKIILNKEKYGILLKRLNKAKKLESNNFFSCMQEVLWNREKVNGFTLADLQNSWVFSINSSHEDWDKTIISAVRHTLEGVSSKIVVAECDIKNIATQKHCIHWENGIRDWGATVAASSVLGEIDGHKIVMYPNTGLRPEHNPPHVHVLNKNGEGDVAKYRIEDYQLEDGKQVKGMKDWLKKYQSQLLSSWERCYQRGGTPYQLEEPEPKN